MGAALQEAQQETDGFSANVAGPEELRDKTDAKGVMDNSFNSYILMYSFSEP